MSRRSAALLDERPWIAGRVMSTLPCVEGAPQAAAGPWRVCAPCPPPTRTRRPIASRSTELAERRRHVLADHGRHARRPDERPRPGRAVRRRDAEALVDQQHDADLRRVLRRARRVGSLGLQPGIWHALARPLPLGLLWKLHR